MLNRIINKVVSLYTLSSSTRYIRHLQHMGVTVGKDCKIFEPKLTHIDTTRPYMLKLGDKVRITKGVTILTHGYEWSVLRDKYGRPFGGCAPVEIGSNVFIGMGATILKGVRIGSNVIIGAGSVISKNVPDNVVIGGNPAKEICSLDDFYNKCCERELIEAKQQYEMIEERYGRKPVESDFYKSYAHLFMDTREKIPRVLANQFSKRCKDFVGASYDGFEDFSEACRSGENG